MAKRYRELGQKNGGNIYMPYNFGKRGNNGYKQYGSFHCA